MHSAMSKSLNKVYLHSSCCQKVDAERMVFVCLHYQYMVSAVYWYVHYCWNTCIHPSIHPFFGSQVKGSSLSLRMDVSFVVSCVHVYTCSCILLPAWQSVAYGNITFELHCILSYRNVHSNYIQSLEPGDLDQCTSLVSL